jgi:NAD(P)-dependent dehydrogenase (short-subunit alcohol dehydrogenase family)
VKLLDGKVVLVTGGTQGVGAGVARAAAREGAVVAVTGRRSDIGEALAASLRETGADAMFVRSDIADVAQAQSAVAAVIDAHGRVDCLVNSAGLTARGSLVDTTPELFDAHIAVNLRGPFFTMQAVVRDMLARQTPGTVVNIISSSEHGGQSYLAPYVAAKAGLAGLTRNVAHAHRFDRIRINGLDIGWTETEGEDATQRMFHAADDTWRQQAAARLPMGKLGQVDEIADFVVFLLSERSGVVTGSVIDWDQNVLGGLE